MSGMRRTPESRVRSCMERSWGGALVVAERPSRAQSQPGADAPVRRMAFELGVPLDVAGDLLSHSSGVAVAVGLDDGHGPW